MFKKMFVSVVLLSSLSMSGGELVVPQRSLRAPGALGHVQLIKNASGFSLKTPLGVANISPAYVDSALRSMDSKTLSKVLAADQSYLLLRQLSNGDYAVRLNDRLQGGGLLGTSIGCFLGKGLVYTIGHGGIQLVAFAGNFVVPGSQPFTASMLTGILSPAIESLSMAAAVSGGIVGGALTGPV